jgi:hypothetical protein
MISVLILIFHVYRFGIVDLQVNFDVIYDKDVVQHPWKKG